MCAACGDSTLEAMEKRNSRALALSDEEAGAFLRTLAMGWDNIAETGYEMPEIPAGLTAQEQVAFVSVTDPALAYVTAMYAIYGPLAPVMIERDRQQRGR